MNKLEDLTKVKEELMNMHEVSDFMRIYQRLYTPKRMYIIMHEKGFQDRYYTLIYVLPKKEKK